MSDSQRLHDRRERDILHRVRSDRPTLAVDLGGTRIKLGAIRAGRVLAQDVIDAESRAGLAGRLPAIVASLRSLCDRAGAKIDECAGIGLAFPSLIDPKTRVITSTNDKYPDAKGFDLVGWAKRELGLPIAVENDANAALAGEWQFGAGRGTQSCVIMTLGTGVGTSAVIDGVPLRGQHGQAGCLGGHFIINAFGRPCTCGGVGCVETEASSWVLPTVVKEHPEFSASKLSGLPSIDYASIFRLAMEEDHVARDVRDRSIRVWAAAAVNLIHAYDPEVVILAGGIMKSPEPTVSMMQKFIDEHAWLGWGRVRIVPGELGDSAALLGLSYLACAV
jgi:glucokinase